MVSRFMEYDELVEKFEDIYKERQSNIEWFKERVKRVFA